MSLTLTDRLTIQARLAQLAAELGTATRDRGIVTRANSYAVDQARRILADTITPDDTNAAVMARIAADADHPDRSRTDRLIRQHLHDTWTGTNRTAAALDARIAATRDTIASLEESLGRTWTPR